MSREWPLWDPSVTRAPIIIIDSSPVSSSPSWCQPHLVPGMSVTRWPQTVSIIVCPSSQYYYQAHTLSQVLKKNNLSSVKCLTKCHWHENVFILNDSLLALGPKPAEPGSGSKFITTELSKSYQSWGLILLRSSELRIELLRFDPRFDDQEQ